jgi:tetratricopeptide (TPR) repeat protein
MAQDAVKPVLMMRFSAYVFISLCLGAALRAADTYPVTPAERAAYEYLQNKGQPVKARETAEAVLRVTPDSFVAYYVIGAVYSRVEGSLPKAHHYLSKARRLIERKWGVPVPSSGPWLWHARVLEELIDVTAEMDRYEEQLDLLAAHDRLYRPPLTASWGWPLMKLGRMDEARAKVQEALKSDKPGTVTHAMNTLGAIENEMDRPEASYEVYTKLVETVRKNGWEMHTVYLRNAGAASLGLLRFEEAERWLLESAKQFDYGTFSNPWRSLAVLYVMEGRMPEAVTAVREMHAWSFRNMPSLQQQSWAERHYVTAAVLLESGYTEEALGILRRVLNRPDRRGGTSLHSDQSEAGLLVFTRHALKVHRENLAEEASWSELKDRPRLWARSLAEAVEMWSAGRRAAALVFKNGRLTGSVRCTAPDGIDVMDWTRIELNEILGSGVVTAEAKRLLKRDDAMGRREAPYLHLTLGYGALLRGDARTAREELALAARDLPKAEVYQRAQAEALLGQACMDSGDEGEALRHFQLAMEKAPGALRAFELALPCRIESDGSPAARKAASLLRGSPRFDDVGAGFLVRTASSGTLVLASLQAPDGTVLCQVRAPLGDDPDIAARLLCKELHRRAFAPRVDLAQTDIASLDGSNLTGEGVRDQIRDLFAPDARPPSAPQPR